MDAILDNKINNQDVQFADTEVQKTLNMANIKTTKENAQFVVELTRDYKRKHAAFRLSKTKGDLMYQKMMQYETRIKDKLRTLNKKGDNDE